MFKVQITFTLFTVLLVIVGLYCLIPNMPNTSLANELYRVFTYGTLKKNEPNHQLMQDKKNGYAKYIGLGRTKQLYPLVIATKYNVPFLLKQPGMGNLVTGEIYDVDSKMLEKLDELEEHPSLYVRTEEDVLLIPDDNSNESMPNFEQYGTTTKAWIYFLVKFKSSLLEKSMYSSYSNQGNHNLKYCERYLRDPLFDHRKQVLR